MMRKRESGPPRPPSQKEIQERVRKLKIRVRVLRDVMKSYRSMSEGFATIMDWFSIVQAEIFKLGHALQDGRIRPETAERLKKELGVLEEQKMILDDILPKDHSAEEILANMEVEIARLEKPDEKG